MKKKVFAVLVALLLVLSVLPSSAVLAMDPSDFTVGAIQAAGITDDAFAQAIYDTIIADTSFVIGNCGSVEEVLASYNGAITVTGAKNMVGVNLLPNSFISFDYSSIEDATPLGSVTSRNVAITANFNPIHNWPTALPRLNGTDVSSGTYAFEQDFRSKGEAVYLDDGTAKIQEIVFDVFVNGSPKWDLEADQYGVMPTYAQPEGATTLDSTLSEGMTSATFKVTGAVGEDGKASKAYIIAAPPEWIYYSSSPRPQSFWPSYVYEITTKYYYDLKVNATATTTGGFYLIKTSSTDPQKVVEGAHYALYTDQACTTLVGDDYKDIVTSSVPVLVEGLEGGKTYWLKETVAAKGYNLNPEAVEITIAGADSSVTLNGAKSVEVTPDESTWKNDWLSSPEDLKKLDLICQEEKVEKNAGANEVFFGDGLATPTITVPDGFEITAVKIGDTTYDNIPTAIDAALTAKKSAVITIEGTYKQTVSVDKDLVTVTDAPVTIWVENTTGSSYGTPKYPENAGGEVYICSRTSFDDPEAAEVAGTRSKISSDGADNNSNNRKENYCACGKAAEGWFVATDQIKIGVRDSRDNNGQYYVTLQKGTQTVTITDPHTGEKYEIEVTVDWNDEMTQACVFVNPQTFPVDIDIAIPFWTPEPVPSTGVSATILAWAMIALAMVYAIISVRKARKEA